MGFMVFAKHISAVQRQSILSNMIRNTKLLALVTIIICGIMFYAGLRPKGFRLHNDVAWLAGTNGVHFGRSGIAYTEKQKEQNAPLPDSVSIELAVKVPEHNGRSSSTILSLWTDGSPESVQLFQWKKYFIVQKRVVHFFKDMETQFGTTLEYGKKYLIVITSCRCGGTALYVNGALVRSSTSLNLWGEKNPFRRLVIGNSANARSPWHGDLFSLSFYRGVFPQKEIGARYRQYSASDSVPSSQGAMSMYHFDERLGTLAHDQTGIFGDLRIPSLLRIPQKRVLTMPWKDFSFSLSYFFDLAVNFSGFVPFGFFFYALLGGIGGFAGRHRLMICALAGSAISLFFELVQVYMPTRSSQMSDLILNILGTLAGIMVYKKLVRDHETGRA